MLSNFIFIFSRKINRSDNSGKNDSRKYPKKELIHMKKYASAYKVKAYLMIAMTLHRIGYG